MVVLFAVLVMIHIIHSLSVLFHFSNNYHKISNISRTKFQNLNAYLVLQLSLPNPMKPGVKSRMKM